MRLFIFAFVSIFSIVACAKKTTTISEEAPTMTEDNPPIEGTLLLDQDSQAVVTAVSITGDVDNYTFSVELSSPDTGCDQYADWWEVFDEEGELIYRRILAHSHVNEQPFTRSGEPVVIKDDTFVYIRGHMNNLGYGSLVFGGTIKDGFETIELPVEFAAELAATEPLPSNCAF